MATDKLTHPAIQSALRKANAGDPRRKLFDGRGLYLLVDPPLPPNRLKAAGYWRLKYRIDGKEKLISLGQYPEVSLEGARRKRDSARRLLDAGTDPSAQRKADTAARQGAAANTFGVVAAEWLGKMSHKWAASNAEKIKSRFDNHILPLLRNEPVGAVTSAKLIEVLQKIEQISTGDTVRRCRQYMNSVFRHAIHTSRLQANPTPHAEVLTPTTRRKFASIKDADRVGALLRSIYGYSGSYTVQCALKLAPLVFVRPGELRAATWDEFDLEAAEWNIRPERMKMRRPHMVPLSRQAVEVLRDLQRLTGTGVYVFPSERGAKRPMSENTINSALRAMGYAKTEMTGHGFRHMASTLLHESRKWASEVIERQLAHADGNKIRGVYNVAEYLPERIQMMQWWADRLDSLAQAKNVVSIRQRA